MPRDNIVTYTKFTPGNAMKSCYVNRIFTHKYALGNFQMLFFARYIYLNVPFSGLFSLHLHTNTLRDFGIVHHSNGFQRYRLNSVMFDVWSKMSHSLLFVGKYKKTCLSFQTVVQNGQRMCGEETKRKRAIKVKSTRCNLALLSIIQRYILNATTVTVFTLTFARFGGWLDSNPWLSKIDWLSNPDSP